jgi:hypothetical protein
MYGGPTKNNEKSPRGGYVPSSLLFNSNQLNQLSSSPKNAPIGRGYSVKERNIFYLRMEENYGLQICLEIMHLMKELSQNITINDRMDTIET